MRGKRKGQPKRRTRSDTSSKARRAVAIKKKRVAAPKTRASNTMSEGEFFSFIRSAMRQKSRFWKPKLEVRRKARRNYSGPNKRQKFEYQCNICKNWFPEKATSVDHINPVGTLQTMQDLPAFVENLFCEEANLQVVCNVCHDKKTKIDKERIKEGVAKSTKTGL